MSSENTTGLPQKCVNFGNFFFSVKYPSKYGSVLSNHANAVRMLHDFFFFHLTHYKIKEIQTIKTKKILRYIFMHFFIYINVLQHIAFLKIHSS